MYRVADFRIVPSSQTNQHSQTRSLPIQHATRQYSSNIGDMYAIGAALPRVGPRHHTGNSFGQVDLLRHCDQYLVDSPSGCG